jgi:hypothetical protein
VKFRGRDLRLAIIRTKLEELPADTNSLRPLVHKNQVRGLFFWRITDNRKLCPDRA